MTTEKAVVESMRTLDYTVEWESRPWLISDKTYTISGTGTIDTDILSRDIHHGGWSPVNLRLSGTDITVSGYSSTGQFTGYLAVSGTVSNLIINSDEYTSTINGQNANNVMKNADYILYVAPGKTFFVITGASKDFLFSNLSHF
jgi:hypothetical protein